jgi:sugar/nucleoside kinase (ribokinase family)
MMGLPRRPIVRHSRSSTGSGGGRFAAGLLYGLLELDDLEAAVEYGAAHGALAMTMQGGAARIPG